MLPPVGTLLVTDGMLTLVGVTAGSVPANTPKVGGIAVSSTGQLYVVFV